MGHWTIAELAEQAAAVLGRDDRAGAPDARTRGAPDPRTIRWYQTTGLIDRPETMRGRTALYGERHLAQLIAIKRLQAEGRSLSVIQAELAGISDTSLQRLAGLSASPADVPRSGSTDPADTSPAPLRQRAAEVRQRFWTASASAGSSDTATSSTDPTDRSSHPSAAVSGLPAEAAGVPAKQPTAGSPAPSMVHGLRLAPGVVLLLEGGRTPDGTDLRALVRASAPLLAELTSRALLEEER